MVDVLWLQKTSCTEPACLVSVHGTQSLSEVFGRGQDRSLADGASGGEELFDLCGKVATVQYRDKLDMPSFALLAEIGSPNPRASAVGAALHVSGKFKPFVTYYGGELPGFT